MADIPALPADDKIVPALIHHFSPEDSGGVITERAKLIELLRRLPALSTEDNVDTVATLLRRHEPGAVFSKEDQAIIAFIDEATTEVLNHTDLDFKIESFIRDISPHLAAIALESGLDAATTDNEFFQLTDLLIDECIGWSEDLGILGQQFMEKIEVNVAGFAAGRLSTKECTKELRAVFKKEAPLFKKLESRLCDRELKVLAGKKAQFFSTQLLNKQMSGQQLPLFIIFMLQGPWFEFLQDVYVEFGEKSKEWQNVRRLLKP